MIVPPFLPILIYENKNKIIYVNLYCQYLQSLWPYNLWQFLSLLVCDSNRQDFWLVMVSRTTLESMVSVDTSQWIKNSLSILIVNIFLSIFVEKNVFLTILYNYKSERKGKTFTSQPTISPKKWQFDLTEYDNVIFRKRQSFRNKPPIIHFLITDIYFSEIANCFFKTGKIQQLHCI